LAVRGLRPTTAGKLAKCGKAFLGPDQRPATSDQRPATSDQPVRPATQSLQSERHRTDEGLDEGCGRQPARLHRVNLLFTCILPAIQKTERSGAEGRAALPLPSWRYATRGGYKISCAGFSLCGVGGRKPSIRMSKNSQL